MNAQLETVPIPLRIARLPRNKVGYPIPWFVAHLDDGGRDFRIAGQEQHIRAMRDRLCYVCGGRLGAYGAFTIGPMCAVNRISAEPPAHRDCAVYSARACPFLTNPAMRRREAGKPDGVIDAAGQAILRNPGVALVWVTRLWKHFRPHAGAPGWLTEFGDPTEVLWFVHGRDATRAEVLESMETGLPILVEACGKDPDPEGSRAELARQVEVAMQYVPAGPEPDTAAAMCGPHGVLGCDCDGMQRVWKPFPTH